MPELEGHQTAKQHLGLPGQRLLGPETVGLLVERLAEAPAAVLALQVLAEGLVLASQVVVEGLVLASVLPVVAAGLALAPLVVEWAPPPRLVVLKDLLCPPSRKPCSLLRTHPQTQRHQTGNQHLHLPVVQLLGTEPVRQPVLVLEQVGLLVLASELPVLPVVAEGLAVVLVLQVVG